MRKDTHVGYHPRSRTVPSSYGKGKMKKEKSLRQHNCVICRHVEAEEVDRKLLEGWRYVDIRRAHPWIRHAEYISDHAKCLGLKDTLNELREIKLKEILEDIIRAGKPMLDEGKVYPRDMIEAAKALSELEKKGTTKKIWELIEHAEN